METDIQTDTEINILQYKEENIDKDKHTKTHRDKHDNRHRDKYTKVQRDKHTDIHTRGTSIISLEALRNRKLPEHNS